MVTYARAKPGFKFVLTELGFEDSRIRAKYLDSNKKQYERCVPSKWVDKGLVKELQNE